VLKAIHKLVEQGAVVAGQKPVDDPSLADDQTEFRRLNDELFGDGSGVHHLGKGSVYAGQNLSEVFKAINVVPDFDYSKPEPDSSVLFAHRKTASADLYFVDNRQDRGEALEATFRVTGKEPELWHPETGKMEPVSFQIANGRTTVPLNLEAWGTVFVVFRKPAKESARNLPKLVETQTTAVDGPWKVSFKPDLGAPDSIMLNALASWTDNSNAGVKYYSGSGTYTKTINAPVSLFVKGAHVWIDLGDVKNLARVTVNGKDLGVVWHAPYRIDVTDALKPGPNELTIKVTNSWVNRLIGDQQPGATKYTYADVKPYKANSPLLPSGLLGPVKLFAENRQ